MLNKNRRAQISDIMTWVIATAIILFILLLFIYSASLFAQKTKTVKAKNLIVNLGDEVSLLDTKNEIAYNSASEEQKQIIDNWEDEHKNAE